MIQILIRFLIGGMVVSAFAVLADMLKPKSFAGLFGAAPSIALATLGLTAATEGASYGERGALHAGWGDRILCVCLPGKFHHDAVQAQVSAGCSLFPSALVGHSICRLARLVEVAMQIKVDPSALRQTRFYEYAIRFLFGGLTTAAAGLIAKEYGPGIGGLFLAFPAIFPASATLIEKHEKQRKGREGLAGEDPGRRAVGVEAVGSAIGSIGLLAFALLVWKFLPAHGTWTVLTAATLVWLAVSVVLWEVRTLA